MYRYHRYAIGFHFSEVSLNPDSMLLKIFYPTMHVREMIVEVEGGLKSIIFSLFYMTSLIERELSRTQFKSMVVMVWHVVEEVCKDDAVQISGGGLG